MVAEAPPHPQQRLSLSKTLVDVGKVNLEATQRVQQAFARGPTHAGQFQFAGTAFEILSRDAKFYGLMLWCALWLALRYGGAMSPLALPASLVR